MQVDDRDKDYYDIYEKVARFEAVYPGRCIIDGDHKIRRGETVYRLGRADNPVAIVTGVCCEKCARVVPWAKGRRG